MSEQRTTIELDIPTAVEGAAKRVMHLIESGYLPAPLKSDLETLMRAALCWDLFKNGKEAAMTATERRGD